MLGALGFLHAYGARVLVLFAVLLGIWGAYHYIVNRPLTGGYRATYLIMAVLVAVQGVLGVAALLVGGNPRAGILHMVYGVFALIFLPGAYRYAQGGESRRETLILAGASWIVTIAFVRGIATG